MLRYIISKDADADSAECCVDELHFKSKMLRYIIPKDADADSAEYYMDELHFKPAGCEQP